MYLTRGVHTLCAAAVGPYHRCHVSRSDPVFLASVLDHLAGVVYVYDLEQGRNVFLTARWAEAFGYSPEESEPGDGTFMQQILHPDDRTRVVQHYERLRDDGSAGPWEIQYRLRTKSGAYVWMSSVDAPLARDEQGRVTRLAGQARDISAQKAAEAAEAEGEARFRAIVESLPDAVFVVGPDAGIKLVNDAACAQVGYSREELLAMTVLDFVPPELHHAVRERVSSPSGTATVEAAYHVRKDGSHVPVEVVLVAFQLDGETAYMGVARDISDRLRLEAQLRDAQRMEAIGRLAGSVAHDFNNLLVVMLGGVSVLEHAPELSEESRELVTELRSAADRAAALTRQLLTFGRRKPARRRAVDLGRAVEHTVAVVRRLVEATHSVTTSLDADCLVFADPAMIDQVVMNLVLNARDAMPEGGEVRLSVEGVGDDVVLTVTDTGIGIAAEDLSRVFEPFFTTKSGERGTGIGLATVYGIVHQHGGHVGVESEVGVGSTFRVSLPRHRGEVADAAPGDAGVKARSRTVLLVEDIEAVRTSLQRMLTADGHVTLAAGSISEALQRWRSASSEIDLVLSDVDLGPREDGRDLVHRLRAERPGLPVILMSGHGVDASTRSADEHIYLDKPFDAATLRRAIESSTS